MVQPALHAGARATGCDVLDIMDDADRADREDIIKEQAIAAIRRRNDSLPGIGYCYYCNAELRGGNRFCDAECRDDYETEKRLKK